MATGKRLFEWCSNYCSQNGRNDQNGRFEIGAWKIEKMSEWERVVGGVWILGQLGKFGIIKVI